MVHMTTRVCSVRHAARGDAARHAPPSPPSDKSMVDQMRPQDFFCAKHLDDEGYLCLTAKATPIRALSAKPSEIPSEITNPVHVQAIDGSWWENCGSTEDAAFAVVVSFLVKY